MCGICGGIGKLDVNIIRGLLVANETRGHHSTGIAARSASGETVIIKEAVAAEDFISRNNLDIVNSSQIVIGHTRWATTGAISNKNAHPLTAGKVTGVHNGVIDNHAQIPHGGEVDSQAIFYLLDKNEAQPEKAFNEISGSCAAAWIVDGDPKLHLVKSSNPLHIATTDNAVYFSSEYHALASVLAAAGVVAEIIAEVKEDTMLTISPNAPSFTVTPVKFKVIKNKWGKGKGGRFNYVDDYELAEEAREREWLSKNADTVDMEALYRSLPDQDSAYSLATEEGCVVCGRIFTGLGEVVYYDKEDVCVYCEGDAKQCGMDKTLRAITLG